MATPAKVQEVRYDVQQPSDWQRFAEAALSIGGGLYLGKQQRARQKEEDMMKLLPILAQMKMLKPGGEVGQPGVMNVPGLGPFSVTAPAADQQELYYQAKIDELRREMGDLPMQPAQAYRMAVNEVSKQISNSVLWQAQLQDKDPNVRMQAERRKDDEISRLAQAYLYANGEKGEHEYPVRKKGSLEPYGTTMIGELGDPNDADIEYQDKDGTWKNAASFKPTKATATAGFPWVNPLTVLTGVTGAAKGFDALVKAGTKMIQSEAGKKTTQLAFDFAKPVVDKMLNPTKVQALSKVASQFAPWATKAVPAVWKTGMPASWLAAGGQAAAEGMMAMPATQNFDIGRTAAAPLAGISPLASLLGTPEGRSALAHPLGYMFNSQYRNDPLGYQGYR